MIAWVIAHLWMAVSYILTFSLGGAFGFGIFAVLSVGTKHDAMDYSEHALSEARDQGYAEGLADGRAAAPIAGHRAGYVQGARDTALQQQAAMQELGETKFNEGFDAGRASVRAVL